MRSRASGCSAGGLTTTCSSRPAISSAVIDEAVGGAPAAVTFMDFHTVLGLDPRARAGRGRRPAHVRRARRGRLRRRAPTGELRESGAMDLVRSAIPELTAEQEYQLCAQHLQAAGRGRADRHPHDGRHAARRWSCCATLESRGDLVTRILAPFTIHPTRRRSCGRCTPPAARPGGRRWRAGVAKFFIDGVIDSGTGWLVTPDSEGAGRELVLARRRPLPAGGQVLQRTGLSVRHPRDRRPRACARR